jgi:hypothetical protein
METGKFRAEMMLFWAAKYLESPRASYFLKAFQYIASKQPAFPGSFDIRPRRHYLLAWRPLLPIFPRERREIGWFHAGLELSLNLGDVKGQAAAA